MNKTRADYPSLDAISKKFASESQAVAQQIRALKQHVENMRGGAWVGKAATAFIAEMDSTVLPSTQRLQRALDSASRATREISTTVKTAEEEAARVLNGNGTGPAGSGAGTVGEGAGSTGSSSSDATAGGTAQGATEGKGGPTNQSPANVPAWKQQNPLAVQDPAHVFSDGNLSNLVGKAYQGAGSPQLRSAMETLWANRDTPNSPAAQAALAQIAEARGVPLERIQADYQKYQQVLEQQRASGKNVEGLNDRNAKFMGKTGQLRYGDVVGQVFGVDPVFGSLLNPTGGLVGPDNTALDLGNTAVAYHGAVHDAGGYLYNYHNTGPGYDYLGREGRDTSSPFSGQIAGIEYWRGKVGNDATSVASQTIMGQALPIIDVVSTGWQGVKDAGTAGSNAYRNIREGDWSGLASDGWRDVSTTAGNLASGAVQTVKDTWHVVRTDAVMVWDVGGDVIDGGRNLGRKLWDKIW